MKLKIKKQNPIVLKITFETQNEAELLINCINNYNAKSELFRIIQILNFELNKRKLL
jgi:hypothetical protein